MTTEVDPRTIAFSLLRPMLTDVQTHVTALESFNNLPDIPWPLREGIRELQGHLDKIDDRAWVLVDRLRRPQWVKGEGMVPVEGDPGAAFMQEMWPDE